MRIRKMRTLAPCVPGIGASPAQKQKTPGAGWRPGVISPVKDGSGELHRLSIFDGNLSTASDRGYMGAAAASALNRTLRSTQSALKSERVHRERRKSTAETQRARRKICERRPDSGATSGRVARD